MQIKELERLMMNAVTNAKVTLQQKPYEKVKQFPRTMFIERALLCQGKVNRWYPFGNELKKLKISINTEIAKILA
jgi:hypothetical protein